MPTKPTLALAWLMLPCVVRAEPTPWLWREAERVDRQQGARGEDPKAGAGGLRCLGSGWGQKPGHMARYAVAVPSDLPDAVLHLRYARGQDGEGAVDVFVDGRLIGASPTLRLPRTGGWGDDDGHWRFASCPVGKLEAGRRTLELVSTKEGGNVNLDGFYLAPAATPPQGISDRAAFIEEAEAQSGGAVAEIRRRVPKAVALPAPAAFPRREPKAADVPALLADAARRLAPGVREALAGKPSPYLVKAHDVGGANDFNTDIPWHALEKEKDARFKMPHAGKLGLVNTNTDVHFILGFAVGDGPTRYSPPRKFTDHLINLIAQEVALDGVQARVLFLPVTSDTVLAVVEARNTGAEARAVRVEAVCAKPPVTLLPFDRYGYGIHNTTGKLQWIGANEANGALVSSYDEWDRRALRPAGALLCAMAGSEKPEETRAGAALPPSRASDFGGPADAVLRYRLDVAPGAAKTLLVALNLHRFGPERVETDMRVVLYPKETEEQALAYSIRAAVEALGADWPALARESFAWYERLPAFRLPPARVAWAADLLCALELPRGDTWSAQGDLRQPWYTFCRVHGHNAYGWWSYGMHGHEHLSTFVVDLVEPALAQSFLRGHFQNQASDGFVPYGVTLRGADRSHAAEDATAPLLMVEAWAAYLWSGDRAFLEEAYACGAKSLAWWRSPARTRPGAPLQHWRGFIETVRDDADLATWAATGGAERQEALDLNCYLLNEERALAAMARELAVGGGFRPRPLEAEGRGPKVGSGNQGLEPPSPELRRPGAPPTLDAAWEADAARREELMRRHLWHEEDRVYYGRDIPGDRWARVMDISTFLPLWCGLATEAQAPRLVELLRDPQAFGTDYPVATLAVRHMPERRKGEWHWRGANWVEMTWLAVQGLKQYGCYAEASRVAEANCRMAFATLEKSGHFREFYNAITGAPSDLTDYIWASMPAAMAVDVFYGVRPTAEGLEILPALPEGWNEIALDNLRVRGARLSLSIRRDAAAKETSVTLNGRPRPAHEGRGAFIPWKDLPADATVAVAQPPVIPETVRPRPLFGASGVREVRLRATPQDGAVKLAWSPTAGAEAARVILYRAETPRAEGETTLAVLPPSAGGHVDPLPNWTPRYYRLEGVDDQGRVVLRSPRAVGLARPAESAAPPVETFAFWYEPYKPTTDPDASLKRIGDAAFVVGPSFEAAAADLAKAGKGLLPYVTFYQTAGCWAESFPRGADPAQVEAAIGPVAFYRGDIRFPGGPPGYVPSVFCRPGHVEDQPGAVQYTVCPNSAALRERVLAHVRRQLDGGALGFFVDNGYADDVAAGARCESARHAHVYGEGLTAADAFLGLMLEVLCEVKKRNSRGVVLLNGCAREGAEFYGIAEGDVIDGHLWESYLRESWHTPREHVEDWAAVYRRSVTEERAAAGTPPRRMYVLSYPWDREEAFFCYATAKLCNLPWAACLGVSDPRHEKFGGHFGTYPELVDVRLGRPVEGAQFGGTKRGDLYVREYEKGIVVVNPGETERAAAVPLGRARRTRDVFSGQEAEAAAIEARLPPSSGRVYVWR